MTRSTNALAGAALLLALPVLSGCVAVAVPLIAAGAIARQQLRTRDEIIAALPAANAAQLAAVPDTRGTSVRLTNLTELPPPSGPLAAGSPWQDFARFSLERAQTLAMGEDGMSALLTRESALKFRAETRPCTAREAAVVIDLDPATAIFAPGSPRNATPDAVSAAAQLRDSGIIVLWVSQASANDVAAIADALKNSGLDPTGKDPILLVRNAEERKQVLREEANNTVCVVAMAGDRLSDFDEMFDYLRDERLTTTYNAELGAGWFLVPDLFEPAIADSAVAPASEDGGR